MNVLVTGASGYIGSLLSKKILDAGYNLRFFDFDIVNNGHIYKIINHPKCKVYEGDLRDKVITNKALTDCDIVIHLAGISDGRMGKKDPEITKEINISATRYLIEKAKDLGVKRFLFASTIGVYGNKYTKPFEENFKLNPIDPYSESKAIGEEILYKSTNANFITCSLRIAMVYGLSVNTRFDFLVNNLVKIAYKNGEVSVLGGQQKRPQIHVQDISDYFLKLITIDAALISGKSFNAVSSNPSVNDLTQIIRRHLPKTKINLLIARENEDSFEMDGKQINKELWIYPQYDIEKGIKELVFYLNQPKKDRL